MIGRLRRIYRSLLYPTDELTIASTIRHIELCLGLRPYRLVLPSGRDAKPQLQYSPVGLAFMFGHTVLYVSGLLSLIILDPQVIVAISVDRLARFEAYVVAGLGIVHALVIFAQLYWGRERAVTVAELDHRLREHWRSIGVDTGRMVRRTGRVTLAGIAFALLVVVTSLAHGAVFLRSTVRTSNQRYVWLFNTAMVMPVVHMEMAFVQFCVQVLSQRIRMDELNGVMRTLAEWERAEAQRSVGRL